MFGNYMKLCLVCFSEKFLGQILCKQIFKSNQTKQFFSKKISKFCLVTYFPKSLYLSYTSNQSLFLKLSRQNNFPKSFLKKGKPNKFLYFLSQKLLYKHKPNTPFSFLSCYRPHRLRLD
ncbi:hypothetical protein CsSME_00053470 [Camellia sinensis var. sinensis]